jgi:hypothetical protein
VNGAIREVIRLRKHKGNVGSGRFGKSFRMEVRFCRWEWKVPVSVTVGFAAAEKRTLANFGAALEWGYEQWKVVGSTERLMKYKISSRVPGGKTRRLDRS